jgi:hypothetical protein
LHIQVGCKIYNSVQKKSAKQICCYPQEAIIQQIKPVRPHN